MITKMTIHATITATIKKVERLEAKNLNEMNQKIAKFEDENADSNWTSVKFEPSKPEFTLAGGEGWDCPTSPIGICEYGPNDPVCWAGCIHCGLPNKRN